MASATISATSGFQGLPSSRISRSDSYTLSGRRVAFIGTGVTNQQCIELFARCGAQITLCDKKPDIDAFGPYAQALRKLAGSIAKTNCVVIFINQLREKVGVMYGNPEVTTGGRALKFYASVRIDVRRIESLKSGSEIIGNRTRAKVVKNKVSPPFKEAEFDIMYGEGISKIGEILDLGAKLDLVQKSGSWFAMGETRLGQGRDAAKQYLKDNPEVCDKLEADIRRNAYKLMSSQARAAAKAAGRAVDISAEEFEDADS